MGGRITLATRFSGANEDSRMADFSDKVFESQFDVIARLVPGAVILGMYPLLQFGPQKPPTIPDLLLATVPAYLIGFWLEHV